MTIREQKKKHKYDTACCSNQMQINDKNFKKIVGHN